MHRSLIIFFCFLTLFGFTQKKVKLNFSYTKPYCGGARPTPEMEAASQIIHPYAHKTIVYVSEKGKTDSVRTDENGNIVVKLKNGTYRFYESWKYYKKTPDGQPSSLYDLNCLNAQYKIELVKVTVNRKVIQINLVYDLIERCPWQMECLLEKNMPE